MKLIKKNTSCGFTLIELLVVISIIGILSAVLLANLVGIRERATDSSLKAGLRSFKNALRLYYNDAQSYPADGTLPNEGEEFNSTTVGQEVINPTVYMKETPKYDYYEQTNNGDGFIIGVILNNLSDGDIAESVENCNVSQPDEGTFYVCED